MHSFTSKLYYLSEIKRVSSNGFVTKKRFSLCLEMSSLLYSHWWSECTHVEKDKMADSCTECKYYPETAVVYGQFTVQFRCRAKAGRYVFE